MGKTALIFRFELLPTSETFVKWQAGALTGLSRATQVSNVLPRVFLYQMIPYLSAYQNSSTKGTDAGFPNSKLRVHYIGVDRALFTAGSKVHRQDLVLFVGRLVEKKGCKYLIQAMDVVQKKRKDIRLVIIGDGPLRQSLESLAREKGIVCQFLRQPANPVIREWLGRAAGILWTEYYRRQRSQEGLPIVLTEAQAMGVPVVSSIHAGIPEAVRHCETGLLAPEREHEILAGHILQYLSDKPFWRRCSEAAPNGLDIASICTRKPASLKAFMLA